tara:strand:+ start:2963 stop:3355 length:393 start_codon:yes stop_codon:yes gene_type:complete
MGTHVGKGGAVYVATNAVAEIKDWALDTSSASMGSSTMGTDWETNKPTLKSWTSSFNAIWDDGDSTGQGALTEGAEITIKIYPTGNTTGKIEWSGACIVETVSKSAAVDGLVEASFSVKGNGALVEATVA